MERSRRRIKPTVVAENYIQLQEDQPGFAVQYIDDFIGMFKSVFW